MYNSTADLTNVCVRCTSSGLQMQFIPIFHIALRYCYFSKYLLHEDFLDLNMYEIALCYLQKKRLIKSERVNGVLFLKVRRVSDLVQL